MKGETHITLGVATSVILLQRAGQLAPDVNAAIVVCLGAFAALLPDIDHDASMISRRVGLLGLPFRLLAHRGFTHSLAALALLYLALDALAVPELFRLAVLGGYASHMLADAITVQGIGLLWPLGWRVRLLPGPLAISTGGVMEHIIAVAVFIGLLIVVVPVITR